MSASFFSKEKSLLDIISEQNKQKGQLRKKEEEKQGSFFSKSSSFFKSVFCNLFLSGKVVVNEDLLLLLEEAFISLDFGPYLSSKISQLIAEDVSSKNVKDSESVKEIIKSKLLEVYGGFNFSFNFPKDRQNIILITGANGTGKTTSVAKLAHKFKEEGYKVLIVSGDTFRAGATQQLSAWAENLGIDIEVPLKHKEDPSALIYRSLRDNKDKGYNLIICDTSGKQHNNKNLLQELSKVHQTIKKFDPSAPHESFLVMDSTIGRLSLSQAESFLGSALVSGIILTKMDRLTRGGIIFAIKEKFNIPVKLIGTGETLQDLHIFELSKLVDFWVKDLEINL